MQVISSRLVLDARRFFGAGRSCGLLFKAGRLAGKLRSNSRGFTLVEVIVAIAILSVSLTVLMTVISGSLRQTSQAEKTAQAGLLAQSLFAEVGVEKPLKEGESAGQFPDGYSWHLSMRRYGDPTEREAWPVGAFAISAEVTWDDGKQKRVYALSTLRLGPKELSR